jgi:hypothetical protein
VVKLLSVYAFLGKPGMMDFSREERNILGRVSNILYVLFPDAASSIDRMRNIGSELISSATTKVRQEVYLSHA